jgi:hypothetical protein
MGVVVSVTRTLRRWLHRACETWKGPAMTQPERDKLGGLLNYLHEQLPKTRLPVKPDLDVAIASLILFRAAVMQGHAIHILCEAPVREMAIANLRQLFEAYVDLLYLLSHGDRAENAARCFIFAHMELLSYVEKYFPDDEKKAEAAKIRAELDRFKRDAPEVYAVLEDERAKGKPKYWSGKTRTEVVFEVGELTGHGGETLKQLYKQYSWEAHHVVNSLRDYRIAESEGKTEVGFGFGINPVERGEELCLNAWGFLAEAWDTFCKVFPQPGVTRPEPAAGGKT